MNTIVSLPALYNPIIGSARALANVHHVEDIVGSAAIALGTVILVYFVSKIFFNK